MIDELWRDYNCEGELSKDDARKFFRDADPAAFNEQHFQQLFSEFDKTGSGSISKTEMKIWVKKETI